MAEAHRQLEPCHDINTNYNICLVIIWLSSTTIDRVSQYKWQFLTQL